LKPNVPGKDITYYDFLAGYQTNEAGKVLSGLTPAQKKQLDSETLMLARNMPRYLFMSKERTMLRNGLIT